MAAFSLRGGGGLVTESDPFAIAWSVAHQTPLSMGLFRILEWVAISSSKRSCQLSNQIHVPSIAVRLNHQGSPAVYVLEYKYMTLHWCQTIADINIVVRNKLCF